MGLCVGVGPEVETRAVRPEHNVVPSPYRGISGGSVSPSQILCCVTALGWNIFSLGGMNCAGAQHTSCIPTVKWPFFSEQCTCHSHMELLRVNLPV